MSHRPSSQQVMERLLPDTIEIWNKNRNFKNELTTRTFLTVPISELHSYDMNPRRLENPNYEKIKESILNDGINQPLVVTQRPGEQNFMIYKGGNTRLKAIRELYEETGSRKFRFIDCSFLPWSGLESDAIIGHLQENEMRKSLCFIDRAYGVKLAMNYLKLESEEVDLSLRECLSLLAKRGFSTTISTLSIMVYATDFVEPLLPRNICASLGRPQVQKLRALENSFRKVCEEFKLTESKQRDLFSQSLQKFDEPTWSHKNFRRSLETLLADSQSTSIQDISLRLNGYLNLSSMPLSESPEIIDEKYISPDPTNRQKLCTDLVRQQGVYSVNTSKTPNILHHFGADSDLRNNVHSPNSEKNQSKTDPVIKSRTPVMPELTPAKHSKKKTDVEIELESLRRQAYELAWRLAKRHTFHENADTKREIVSNTGNWGVGYLITDYPAAATGLSASLSGTRDALWWLLLENCDLQWAMECARPLTAKIVGNSELRHYIKSGNARTLYMHAKDKMKCTYPHLGLLNFCIRQLDDESWNDVHHLTWTYRWLHQLARTSNIHLFKLPKTGGMPT